MYKDKQKQKEANRLAQAKFKAKKVLPEGITEQGITGVGILQEDYPLHTITDAVGVQHPVDYKGRREAQALLDGWRRGEGTKYQQTLAILGEQYSVIKRINKCEYLGLHNGKP